MGLIQQRYAWATNHYPPYRTGMSFRAAARNKLNIIADVEMGGADKEDYVNDVGLEYVF